MTTCNGILERNTYAMMQFRAWVTSLFPICPSARSRLCKPLFYLHILTYVWIFCIISIFLHQFSPEFRFDLMTLFCLCAYLHITTYKVLGNALAGQYLNSSSICSPTFPFFVIRGSSIMSSHSPRAKKASKSKWREEDNTGSSSRKKHKADATHKPSARTSTSEHRELHRSDRTGAGVGGHLHQLERVALAIEGPQHISRPTTAFSDGTASNPVAPSSGSGRKKVLLHLFQYVIHNNLFLETASAAYAPPLFGHSRVNDHTTDWVRSFKLSCWISS